jgi:pantothenate kinase
MNDQVNRLVDKTWSKVLSPTARATLCYFANINVRIAKYHSLPASQRLLIAIGGIPGSGKTTLAALVVLRLNKLYASQYPAISRTSPLAAFVPMDGYHLSRAQLSAMPDPITAHARRGAAFTFDGDSYLKLVRQLRDPICPETGTFYAPSFDHAVKDPVYDDIAIGSDVRVVVFEGNYCCLSIPPWKDAAALMDELWFVEVDFQVAKSRLIRRHVEAEIAKDEKEAAKRAEENDLVNGKEIVENRLPIDEIVISVDDEEWKPERQGFGDLT